MAWGPSIPSKAPPGVPKGKPGPVPRFLNKASGKMETAQAMRGYRAPQVRQQAVEKAAGRPSGGHAGAPAHVAAPVKSWLEMNPAETHAYATKQVTQNTQAELQPYRQKAGEISGQEQAVSQRYAGYGQATDTQLAGLQGKAAEGAKTFNNQIADTVLKAQQSVDTTGQNAQAQNAGYLDPQVRAALAAQQGNVQATGVAAQTAAQSQGQSSQNLLANQRAAAAQRVVEGQGAIAGKYGAQRAANTGAENQLLGRVPGGITKLETDLGSKQFNARATEQGLGIKLGATRQKAAETKERVGATERGQNLSRQSSQERTAATVRGQNVQKWAKEADLNYKETHPAGTKPTTPKAPSPAEGRKYMGNISKAESIAHQQGVTAGTPPKRLAEVRKYLQGLGYNGDQVSAAMNLAYYGVLGPQDRKTAEAYGLTKQMRPNWFRPHK